MEYITIGDVKIEKAAALAPMASVADLSYRRLCKKFGAAYTVGEMASAKGLCYSDKKTKRLLFSESCDYPFAVQLFGNEPDIMAKAVKIVSEFSPQIIDVNMGCPVPKVFSNGCGSALMKTPELAYDIIKAMVKVSDIPITVKIRKGIDDENVNAVEFAKLMQDAGASAVTIHGRTKQQMYKPPIDLDIIKEVKAALKIPVIGNGGITTPKEAKEMYDHTGCDLIMVGQGSYGRPWIFKNIKEYLETGKESTEPTLLEKLTIMKEHIEDIVAFEGEKLGMKQARKYASWYVKGEKGAAALRERCSHLETLNDLYKLIDIILKSNT